MADEQGNLVDSVKDGAGKLKDDLIDAGSSLANNLPMGMTVNDIGNYKKALTDTVDKVADGDFGGLLEDAVGGLASFLGGGSDTVVTSSVPSTPFYATGREDVVKMEYMLLMGHIDTMGTPETPLAYTESFLEGISLTEISWGYLNTATTEASKDDAFLKFTLHDIAGETLGKFFRLRSGTQLIYFHGPMSDGSLWFGDMAIYKPVTESCEMTFSLTQGFTYSIVAEPVVNMAKTMMYRNPKEFSLTGTYEQQPTGNTFKDYMKEFVSKWNAGLPEDRKGTSKIEIDYGDDSEGAQADLWTRPVQVTDKTSAGEQSNPNNPIQHHAVPEGANLSHEIVNIWQNLFTPVEKDTTAQNTSSGANLEVNFKQYKEGVTMIHLRLHKKEETSKVDFAPFVICIGSDLNCQYQIFRAQLVELRFSGLYSVLGATVHENSPESGDTTLAGSKSETPNTNNTTPEMENDKSKENMAAASNSTGPASVSQEHGYDGWGTMRTLLNDHKTPELTIDVELNYAFAFSPQSIGGWLKDALESQQAAAIHPSQGAFLLFFWYEDIHCENLVLNDVISTSYRITKVMHTVGLNGNMTQVGLSHLHISI